MDEIGDNSKMKQHKKETDHKKTPWKLYATQQREKKPQENNLEKWQPPQNKIRKRSQTQKDAITATGTNTRNKNAT